MILKEIMARTQLIHVIICPSWKPDRNSVRFALLPDLKHLGPSWRGSPGSLTQWQWEHGVQASHKPGTRKQNACTNQALPQLAPLVIYFC